MGIRCQELSGAPLRFPATSRASTSSGRNDFSVPPTTVPAIMSAPSPLLDLCATWYSVGAERLICKGTEPAVATRHPTKAATMNGPSVLILNTVAPTNCAGIDRVRDAEVSTGIESVGSNDRPL